MPAEFCADEAATRRLAAEFAKRLRAGDVVLLKGPLGAGKTTFVRGVLEGLGYDGPVRSPTFNLIQTFDTDPPVLHADLYRLPNAQGIGLEDYLDTHLCLIEWPEKDPSLERSAAWKVTIEFEGAGRTISLRTAWSGSTSSRLE